MTKIQRIVFGLLLLVAYPAMADTATRTETPPGATRESLRQQLYRTANEANDPYVMYLTGLMFDLGAGVPQDYKEAFRWYVLAAEAGQPAAMNSLGLMYALGHGVSQDHSEAMRLWAKAADNGSIAAQWLHFTNKGYDLVYTRDWTGSTGRLHHVAFSPDNREDILRAADICLEAGVFIETGPHKHAIQQTFFLYVYEPGGNRIELANPVARLVLAPDWRTITWTEAERAKGQAWGLKTIESFHTHGTPPVG